MLFAKRLDAFAGPANSLFLTAEKMGYKRDQLGEPLVLNTKEPWAFYSKKTANPQIISVLKNAMERLRKENCFEKIVRQYLEESKK